MPFKLLNIDRNQTSDFWGMRKSETKRLEGKGYIKYKETFGGDTTFFFTVVMV